MSAQSFISSGFVSISHCHCSDRRSSAAFLLQAHEPCLAKALRRSSAVRSQATNASAPNAKDNGAKMNGSSPANQPGQAAAPKAPGEAPPKAKAKSKGFNNVNKFIVPEDKMEEFEEVWHEREGFMQQMPGFLGFTLEQKEGCQLVATSRWASIPEWEAYSLSEVARRSHLPWGVYQYVPAKGEGFPEDFIPFKTMDTLVNAKY